MVAEGMARLLSTFADVVGVARDGHQLVRLALQFEPAVVVSDVMMPGLSGLDAFETLKAAGFSGRFVFVTALDDARLAARCLRSGAGGVLSKVAAGDELMAAVRAVASGGTFISPILAADVLRIAAETSAASPQVLTSRQREVLVLLAEGRRMKEVALELGISVRTVEHHKYEAMDVLGLDSTAALIRYVLHHGMAGTESV
jgi:DNA-binding NarL/FixJ family response regulator